MGKNQKEKTGRVGGRNVSATVIKNKVTNNFPASLINREFSSGGVVFKRENSKILWLITHNSPNEFFKPAWRLPKGWIDEGEKPQETAIREVKEEAGVEAKIVKKIEDSKYVYNHPDKGRVFKVVTFFLMEYVKDLPEGFGEETTEIKWVEFEEGYKLLSYSGEKQIFKKAQKLLDSGIQNQLL